MTRACLRCTILGGLLCVAFGAAIEAVLNLVHAPFALAWAALIAGWLWGYWTRFMQNEHAENAQSQSDERLSK